MEGQFLSARKSKENRASSLTDLERADPDLLSIGSSTFDLIADGVKIEF